MPNSAQSNDVQYPRKKRNALTCRERIPSWMRWTVEKLADNRKSQTFETIVRRHLGKKWSEEGDKLFVH